MFNPKMIYYEENIKNYKLGRFLLKKYENIPKNVISNHNNIESLRKASNKEFIKLKKNLIIGIRKTHKFVPNNKISNYLVPYTSSGCSGMCLYCYLVCHFNKCSYLRLFVNREDMLKKIIKTSNKSDKELVFEIGSNSDLVLENEITGNLVWTIEEFGKNNFGYITFPTKFSNIDMLLKLKHFGKTIIRISVNPEEIIKRFEIGTDSLDLRIAAINKLKLAGYKVGILIAPIIMIESWKEKYEQLIKKLSEELNSDVKKTVFFEVIFMTYSYVHRKINEEAFKIDLYDKESMISRGRGKYGYKLDLKEKGEEYIRQLLNKYFPNSKIVYVC